MVPAEGTGLPGRVSAHGCGMHMEVAEAPANRRRPKGEASAAPRSEADSHKTVNLALQGGGAHGAFTWGVLDRLLEDERLIIDGISATSAGAMNGAIMVHGWQLGGRAGARGLLRRFWRRIAECGEMSPIQP